MQKIIVIERSKASNLIRGVWTFSGQDLIAEALKRSIWFQDVDAVSLRLEQAKTTPEYKKMLDLSVKILARTNTFTFLTQEDIMKGALKKYPEAMEAAEMLGWDEPIRL